MMLLRIAAIVALVGVGAVGCSVDGPQRASDIQNLHGISDDISAVGMTDSDTRRARDPNMHSALPSGYETYER